MAETTVVHELPYSKLLVVGRVDAVRFPGGAFFWTSLHGDDVMHHVNPKGMPVVPYRDRLIDSAVLHRVK